MHDQLLLHWLLALSPLCLSSWTGVTSPGTGDTSVTLNWTTLTTVTDLEFLFHKLLSVNQSLVRAFCKCCQILSDTLTCEVENSYSLLLWQNCPFKYFWPNLPTVARRWDSEREESQISMTDRKASCLFEKAMCSWCETWDNEKTYAWLCWQVQRRKLYCGSPTRM